MTPTHNGIIAIILLISGCVPDPKSGKGFTLPDGDADRGEITFALMQCQACHTVSGVNFDDAEHPDGQLVALGGKTTRVRTYGELVTSIINPSHRFAQGYTDDAIKVGEDSRMRVYNDELTVTQLTDLVSFLQQHYEIIRPDPTPYVPY